ncbi:hypothetical protein [Nocardioides sp. InS609-2]|uniref:hypothetical protein n=1 Tax=Nocardioides sp. InS609-2 TaxID=2760705 RepID=UPI0020BFBA61|nr:hypothetical protein [Nocardioides sp. InS609-2]
MSRMVGAAEARLRQALALTLGGTGAFMILSLLTTTTSAPSAVMLAAVSATVAAVVGMNRLPVTLVSGPPGLPRRSAGEVPALRAGRVTDSPRHPLRPRAPGLV